MFSIPKKVCARLCMKNSVDQDVMYDKRFMKISLIVKEAIYCFVAYSTILMVCNTFFYIVVDSVSRGWYFPGERTSLRYVVETLDNNSMFHQGYQ